MAVSQKAVRGTGLTQLRSSVSTANGTTVTEVETWTGPYAQLKIKQDAVKALVKGTGLQPTQANHGQLTITRETELPAASPGGGSDIISEVVESIQRELRKPVETNPYFSSLTPDEILAVKKAVEAGNPVPSEGEAVLKLWELLAKGTTEWVTGVPVVRRVTTRRVGQIGVGRTWFRDDPPIEVEGGWQFLKTADERRKEGSVFTQTEEWTGAEEWDTVLYPEEGGDP